MTALPRETEPMQKAGEEAFLDTMEILSAWDCVRVQSKAGDIGPVRYREAIGIAIAKATNKCLRNEVIRCSYNLVPKEALAERSVNSSVTCKHSPKEGGDVAGACGRAAQELLRVSLTSPRSELP
jgi:hypothetical protein